MDLRRQSLGALGRAALLLTPPADKAALRRAARAVRDGLSPIAREAMAARIVHHLCTFLAQYPGAGRIGIYRGMRSEVRLEALTPWASAHQKTLFAPRLAAGEAGLRFVPIDAQTAWEAAAGGFLEPVGPGLVASELDVVLVPGLLFDDAGYRLGYGGGHYDRALHNTTAYAVGVCFSAQRTHAVPTEGHDVRLDACVDERGLHIYRGDLPQTIASERRFT